MEIVDGALEMRQERQAQAAEAAAVEQRDLSSASPVSSATPAIAAFAPQRIDTAGVIGGRWQDDCTNKPARSRGTWADRTGDPFGASWGS